MILLTSKEIEQLESKPDMIINDNFRQNKYVFNAKKKALNPYFSNFRRFSSRYECSLAIHKGKVTKNYQETIKYLLGVGQVQKLTPATRYDSFERLQQFYHSITSDTLSAKQLEKEFLTQTK